MTELTKDEVETISALDKAAEVIMIFQDRENIYREAFEWLIDNDPDDAMVRFIKSKMLQVDRNHPFPKGV